MEEEEESSLTKLALQPPLLRLSLLPEVLLLLCRLGVDLHFD